jgi:2-polyprenyl-6-methoxyphenol hydroxylase-like FAD-dependent oxidoreductase
MIFAADDAAALPLDDTAAQAAYVRRCLSGMKESHAVVEAITQGAPIYLERVSQVRMARWFRPRVALLGDAAHALSQLTGQGASLALAGAYVLAGELARASAPAYAFAGYEGQLRPLTEDLQREIEAWRHVLAPKSYFGIFARNQTYKLMRIPVIAKHLFGRTASTGIDLLDYQISRWPPETETHVRSQAVTTT